MVLLPPAPQAGASASSATSAWSCIMEVVRLKPDTTYYSDSYYSDGPAKAGHYVLSDTTTTLPLTTLA